MNNYIMAIILIPTYILLGLLGRRFLKFAHGYEKGLEDAEKIRKMEEKRLLDEIRAEITNHLQIMDICDVKTVNGVIVQSELVNRKVVLYDSVMQIIDKYKAESEG